MNRIARTMVAMAVLGTGAAAAAPAQNVGMPLFVNPHYTPGIRLHVDAGRPKDQYQNVDVTTVQGGVSFAIGPVGISALAAGNISDINTVSGGCGGSTAIACSQTYWSVAGLANLRLVGGGHNPLALSAFGGVGGDVSALEAASGTLPRQLTIPVGVAVGYKLGPLMLWGAPRYNFYKLTSCSGTCPTADNDFRWSAGVGIPLGPLGIRAAYDGGKLNGVNQDYIGVGVSLGIGSQQ